MSECAFTVFTLSECQDRPIYCNPIAGQVVIYPPPDPILNIRSSTEIPIEANIASYIPQVANKIIFYSCMTYTGGVEGLAHIHAGTTESDAEGRSQDRVYYD